MKPPPRHTFIDLFCGCGGFSLGMERADFQCLAAIDFNAHAVQVFKANFANVPHALEKDLTQFTPQELEKLFASLGRKEVVRHSASKRVEAESKFDVLAAPNAIKSNDTLVILFKGHASNQDGRVVFHTDDYRKIKEGSGITPLYLKTQLERLRGKPSQILVLLDWVRSLWCA